MENRFLNFLYNTEKPQVCFLEFRLGFQFEPSGRNSHPDENKITPVGIRRKLQHLGTSFTQAPIGALFKEHVPIAAGNTFAKLCMLFRSCGDLPEHGTYSSFSPILPDIPLLISARFGCLVPSAGNWQRRHGGGFHAENRRE